MQNALELSHVQVSQQCETGRAGFGAMDEEGTKNARGGEVRDWLWQWEIKGQLKFLSVDVSCIEGWIFYLQFSHLTWRCEEFKNQNVAKTYKIWWGVWFVFGFCVCSFYFFFFIWNAQFSILIFALLGSAHIVIHSLNWIFLTKACPSKE